MTKLHTYVAPTLMLAQHLAKCAASLGADGVKLTRTGQDLFRVAFRGDWQLERAVIKESESKHPFRHGSSYTDEESELLRNCYFLGWPPGRIAKLLRREENAVIQRLVSSGLWHEFPDILDDHGLVLNYPAALAEGALVEYDAQMLLEAGLLMTLPAYENGAIPVATLPREVRAVLHAALVQDSPTDSIDLANATGDWELGLSVARQQGLALHTCYHYVKDASGLFMQALFQRELLHAHAWSRCLRELPAQIENWVNDAKERRLDYMRGNSRAPDRLAYPLSKVQLANAPVELAILANATDKDFLLPLMRQGHPLAACCLTDLDSLRYRIDPTHSSVDDQARHVQGDFWPTAQFVSALLEPLSGHDPVYARWMAWALSQPEDSDALLDVQPWARHTWAVRDERDEFLEV